MSDNNIKENLLEVVYNDCKYLFTRQKRAIEMIHNESQHLGIYMGNLINAVGWLSKLSISYDESEFVSVDKSFSFKDSDVLTLNFMSSDNNSLYALICSVSEQFQSIDQKCREMAIFYKNRHIRSYAEEAGVDVGYNYIELLNLLRK